MRLRAQTDRFPLDASGRGPFFGNCQDPQSFHKYAYVHGDPIQGVDPTGEFHAGLVYPANNHSARRATAKDASRQRLFDRYDTPYRVSENAFSIGCQVCSRERLTQGSEVVDSEDRLFVEHIRVGLNDKYHARENRHY